MPLNDLDPKHLPWKRLIKISISLFTGLYIIVFFVYLLHLFWKGQKSIINPIEHFPKPRLQINPKDDYDKYLEKQKKILNQKKKEGLTMDQAIQLYLRKKREKINE